MGSNAVIAGVFNQIYSALRYTRKPRIAEVICGLYRVVIFTNVIGEPVRGTGSQLTVSVKM